MFVDATVAVFGLYGLFLPLWLALSAWTAARARGWAFTPRWHRAVVPCLRTLFLLSLPLEFVIADRVFLPPLFGLAGVATLGWLGWRLVYLVRAPRELPPDDSFRFNAAYLGGLITFALACHSYLCLAVMINVSLPLLLVRERYQQRRLCMSGSPA